MSVRASARFAFLAVLAAGGCGEGKRSEAPLPGPSLSEPEGPEPMPPPKAPAEHEATRSGSAVKGLEIGRMVQPLSGGTWFTTDGQPPDLAGTVRVIAFWFSRSGECVTQLKKLERLAELYRPHGLRAAALSFETNDMVRRFREINAIRHVALLSEAERSVHAYGVEDYPTFFLIGRDEKILWKGTAVTEELIRVIKKELEEKG